MSNRLAKGCCFDKFSSNRLSLRCFSLMDASIVNQPKNRWTWHHIFKKYDMVVRRFSRPFEQSGKLSKHLKAGSQH